MDHLLRFRFDTVEGLTNEQVKLVFDKVVEALEDIGALTPEITQYEVCGGFFPG